MIHDYVRVINFLFLLLTIFLLLQMHDFPHCIFNICNSVY